MAWIIQLKPHLDNEKIPTVPEYSFIVIMRPNNMYTHPNGFNDSTHHLQHMQEISVDDLQEELSLCINENGRLKEALKRTRDQELSFKKEYDAMFRELQIEQCRLMLTIEEQDNQLRKAGKEMAESASKEKSFVFLQEEVETLNENLERIRDTQRTQSEEYKEEAILLRDLVDQLKRENSSLKDIEAVLNQKLDRLEAEAQDQDNRIISLEANEQKLKKTYQIEVNFLHKQHQQIKKLLSEARQEMVLMSGANEEGEELLEMIHKLRDSNKSLMEELDLKTKQSSQLIEEIENLKETEFFLKTQQQDDKRNISQQLQLLMTGFNEQIINYQNKVLFLLEYLEEVELGKAQKVNEMRQQYQALKESLKSLMRYAI